MLVLSRKTNQSIMIGDEIEITVLSVSGEKVRLGIKAPREVPVYRDEVYNEDSPDKGSAEIIIGKQRNGPIGTCRLAFLGKYTRFENLAGDYFADH